jgi:hypothetical protein
MKKAFAEVIFGLLVMVTLGAQTVKPKLVVRDLAGGSRSDGKNIAAMLADQALIRENFILVAEDEDPNYVISGEIRRAGISYTASFIMTDARTNEELVTERFIYRDSLEIAAYTPAIAYSLSSAALPGLARRGNIIPLPELPAQLPPEVEISVIVEAPVVIEVAPPVVQVEPPKPEPIPAAPPVLPANEDKLLHLGAWLSISPIGGKTERYYVSSLYTNENEDAGEAKPPVGVGLELDLRPFEHWGFKAGMTGTSMSQDRDVEIPFTNNLHYKRADWGLMLTIAPEYLFKLFDVDLGVYLGLGSYFHMRHNGFMDTALGIYSGLEGEFLKLGPGDLFATINMAYLFGTSEADASQQVLGLGYKGMLHSAFALNIGIGYRFGFIAKKSK